MSVKDEVLRIEIRLAELELENDEPTEARAAVLKEAIRRARRHVEE